MALPDLHNSLIGLFNDLYERRAKLYDDYKNLDKAQISNVWKQFTKELFPSLMTLLDNARLLTSRFVDEYNKDKENILADDERNAKISGTIQSLFSFRTELSFLMLALDIIRNEGIFEIASQPQFIGFTNEVYLELDEITGNFFSDDLPIQELEEVKTMVSLFMDNSLKLRRLILSQIYPELEEDNEKAKVLRADIDESLGNYINDHLIAFLSGLSEKWWYHDPLVNYTLLIRGLDYLKSSLEFYSPKQRVERFNHIKKIEMVSIPSLDLQSSYQLVNFYHTLIEIAMENSDYSTMDSSYQEIKTEISDGLEILEDLIVNEDQKNLQVKLKELDDQVDYRHDIFQVTRLSNDLFLSLSDSDDSVIDDIIEEINSILNKTENSYESHLSQLTLLYQSFLGYFGTKESRNVEMIKSKVKKPFNQFQKIILNQLMNSLNKLLAEINDDIDHEIFQSKIRVIITDFELMKESIACLPDFTDAKSDALKFIKATIQFLESLSIAILPQIYGNLDKLSELSIWTKSYYMAKSANDLINDISDNFPIKINKDMYHRQLSESFEICLDLQFSIYILNIQYITLNSILRSFFQAISQEPENFNEEDKESAIQILDRDERFVNFLDTMVKDSMAVINYNNEDNYSIELDFDLTKRYHLSKAILHYYTSIKLVLKAHWLIKLNKYLEAEDLLQTAKDHAFNASEVSRGIVISDIQGDLEGHLFSFGQFIQDMIQNTRREENLGLPASQQMFGLLRDMIFAL